MEVVFFPSHIYLFFDEQILSLGLFKSRHKYEVPPLDLKLFVSWFSFSIVNYQGDNVHGNSKVHHIYIGLLFSLFFFQKRVVDQVLNTKALPLLFLFHFFHLFSHEIIVVKEQDKKGLLICDCYY